MTFSVVRIPENEAKREERYHVCTWIWNSVFLAAIIFLSGSVILGLKIHTANPDNDKERVDLGYLAILGLICLIFGISLLSAWGARSLVILDIRREPRLSRSTILPDDLDRDATKDDSSLLPKQDVAEAHTRYRYGSFVESLWIA